MPVGAWLNAARAAGTEQALANRGIHLQYARDAVVRCALEVGVDITGEHTRQLTQEMIRRADRVVVLGRDARVEPVDDTPVEICDTDEPSERGIDGIDRMRLVRDDIAARVELLAQELLHTPG